MPNSRGLQACPARSERCPERRICCSPQTTLPCKPGRQQERSVANVANVARDEKTPVQSFVPWTLDC